MRRDWRIVALVLVFTSTASLAALVVAATNPQSLFTDNIGSSGPTMIVTAMEQELLDRINGASVSIDVSIYDFNRVAIRDALIAAHNRGVTVRVVTDDDAYTNPSYNTHYTALEAAGITVINDSRSSAGRDSS